MFRRFAALIASLLLAFVAVPAHADTIDVAGIPIEGKILTTWRAKGGEAVIGIPVEARVGVTIAGRTGWHQHFTAPDGTPSWVAWTYKSAQAGLAPAIPKLTGVANERDALAGTGYKQGQVYRSGKLCNATLSDRLLMAGMLADDGRHLGSAGSVGMIVDLRTPGVVKGCKDPVLPDVDRTWVAINGDAVYSRYVTSEARRVLFGRVLEIIAETDGPVWIHCTAGKDRTGWVISMLLYTLGASDAEVEREFTRTPDAPLREFRAAIALARSTYGSIDGYLEELGVTPELRHALQDKLA